MPATAALTTAADLFASRDQPIERAKALNMLGAAHQQLGRLDDAATVFVRAAELFEDHELGLEHGAARFNLGLVHRARAEDKPAADRFAQALALFEEGGPVLQISAAARELGAARLELGELDAAAEVLTRALELGVEAGHRLAIGTSANLLGLVCLAADRPDAAIEAFTTALSAYPRRGDPEGHAMASANLALAHERAGDAPRARLAARQARRSERTPANVREQADALLGRLGASDDDVLTVLDQLPSARWIDEARPELVGLLDAHQPERVRVLGGWIDGQLTRGGAGPDLAAVLLEVLLELPPDEMAELIEAMLVALQERDPEPQQRFRSQISRAMARFHIPQWSRLQTVFGELGTKVGDDGDWT